MSSHHLGSFTAVEDVGHISPEDVVGLCSRVEARLTVSSGSDESQTEGMSREETALMSFCGNRRVAASIRALGD